MGGEENELEGADGGDDGESKVQASEAKKRRIEVGSINNGFLRLLVAAWNHLSAFCGSRGGHCLFPRDGVLASPPSLKSSVAPIRSVPDAGQALPYRIAQEVKSPSENPEDVDPHHMLHQSSFRR